MFLNILYPLPFILANRFNSEYSSLSAIFFMLFFRYDSQSFSYEVPITKDGDYALVLKFSEVWFTQPNQKVVQVF